MDFDEYEYLEKMVDNPDASKSEKIANGSEETVKNEDKGRRHSSRHRSDKDNDERRSKRTKSGEELRDREKERGSSHHRSSPKDADRDRQRSHRETRDRDREKDRVRGRREYEREREDKDKDHDRTHRNGSRSERHGNERDREKSRDREMKDRDREREREKEKERETRESDRESRRYKDKKEGAAEPEVDPERDQRTVFAYQISLKADERDVYEFFSRAGKVRDVRLIMDRNSRRSKGVGYIEFYDAMSVPMAIALSGQPLLGHPVMVKPSEAEKNLVQSTATVGGIAGTTAGARKLYVGNLHYNMKEDQLRQVFESFGTVELVQLPTDETGNCKGFGFIQFARLEDARAAQSLNGQLEIAGRIMKVSAITDQPGMQETGVNPADFDDDDGGGLALNAQSRALLMQKLDRSGTTSGVGSLGIPTSNGTGVTSVIPAIASMPIPPVTVPSIESIGVPSECLLLNNMFDPKLEEEPDFDLDIKEDVQSECSKFGKLRHIYVEKNSAGFVYLRFENTQSAVAAQRALHGRWFAGKMITASFMMPQNYEAKFPDSI